MKILHLRASNFYGGPERQLHFHARQVQGTEFDVTIGSFTEAGRSPRFLQVIAADDLKTTLLSVRSPYDPRAVRTVRDYLIKNDIDLLCTHDYRTHLVGWLAVRGSRRRWVAFSRGWTRENLKVRLYHWLDRIILRWADHVVAVSAAQKRRLRRLLIPQRKISVVHNAVDVPQLQAAIRVDLRARLGLPAESLVFVAAGRFSREKGQADLVRAVVDAVGHGADLHLVLFGDGPDLDKIRHLAAGLSGGDRIHCPGFEPELIGCLKGADVLVNPSLSEGLPNIVLEAMALGVPVIATAVGGVPEIITDESTGYLVRAGDRRALSDAIWRVCGNIDQARQLAAAALKFADEQLTFEKQNQKLSAIYRQLQRE